MDIIQAQHQIEWGAALAQRFAWRLDDIYEPQGRFCRAWQRSMNA